MSQDLISLAISDADDTEIDSALSTLEAKLASLIDLSSDERRSLSKMGDKSEAFCRQTLTVLTQNPQRVPASLDLAEAGRDLAALDALRSRTTRPRQLLGKGSGLEALRKGMSARFARSPAADKGPAAAL
jgi:hypothetical protein